MIKQRTNHKLRDAIETLKEFDGNDFYYWLESYKNLYGLTDGETGFVINFIVHGRREYSTSLLTV